jgi:hypothetical protein
MAPRKKTGTSSEILEAQREYARVLKGSYRPYTLNQIQMILGNKSEDATEVLAYKLFTGFTDLHYLFLFSLNSDEDASVFSYYSSVYTSLKKEFQMVKSSCKKSKVDFDEICSLVMQWTPAFVYQGRGKQGSYTWEDGLSELAIDLRRQYAKEMPDKNHVNVMKEHFDQFGLKY